MDDQLLSRALVGHDYEAQSVTKAPVEGEIGNFFYAKFTCRYCHLNKIEIYDPQLALYKIIRPATEVCREVSFGGDDT